MGTGSCCAWPVLSIACTAAQLYAELKPCLAAHPHDGDLAGEQRCSDRHAYVRSWASLQTRCPRCGRQSMPSRKLDGTIDTNRYMHLCDCALNPTTPGACTTLPTVKSPISNRFDLDTGATGFRRSSASLRVRGWRALLSAWGQLDDVAPL